VCLRDTRWSHPDDPDERDPDTAPISHVVGTIVCHRHPYGDERQAIFVRVVEDADLVRAG
jgi:hypothetical protein